jgi:vitamin B12 transporter
MFRIAIYSITAIAFALATPCAQAADKIEKVVVTANRIGAASGERLGTAISVLTREQLDQRQTRFVSDVLRDVPGIAVSRSGGPGSSTQVRMRGAEGNHTLVLLDGADIGDPFQGEFDFAGLLASDIERIEILRGSQSALYGSDAIGGVINIIARRGKGDLAVEGFAEAGSFETWQAGANAGYGDGQSDVFVSLNRHETAGTNMSRFGSERDGERDASLFFNAGLRPVDNLELRALLRYVDTKAEGDPQDFDFLSPTQGFVVDGDDVTETEQLQGNVSAEWSAFSDSWRTRLNYAFIDADRKNFSAGAPSFFSSGDRRKLSLVSALAFDTGAVNHKLTGAVDWKREHYQNVAIGPFDPGINGERELDTTGYVASYDLSLGKFDAGAAFRHDRNDRFKDADTIRLQASYRLSDDTRLRATMGSGIKNPTNFELFGFDPSSFVGNPNLKPEQSKGWDVGIDQSFAGGAARLTATYFEAELTDEIYTDFSVFPFTAGNRADESDRRGIELTLDAALADDWSLAAAYTYLDAIEAGLKEVRRAPHTGSLNLTYRFLERASATLTVRYNGRQQDNEFIFATPQDFVALPAFTLVNLNTSYEVSENLQLTARVENLLDERYEEVFTYRAPGIAAYVGLRARF